MRFFKSHTNQTTESFISLQNDVAFTLVVTLVVMSAINATLHIIATRILISIHRRSSQIINLINLSTIQTVVSCLVFMDECAELVYDCIDIRPAIFKILKKVECYMYISIYVAFCLFYVSMILLILDRFLLVYLNLRYDVYWSPQKSKKIVVVVWILSVFVCVVLCLVHWLGVFNYQAILTGIVSPVFNISLLMFALLVYLYIFHQYRSKRNNPQISVVENTSESSTIRHEGASKMRIALRRKRKESVYDTFRNSRFYLDFLMVVSFLLFLVAPNLLYICHGWEGRERTHEAKDANKVSYQLLFLINFVLCVLMNTDFRKVCKSRRGKRKTRIQLIFL